MVLNFAKQVWERLSRGGSVSLYGTLTEERVYTLASQVQRYAERKSQVSPLKQKAENRYNT